MILEARDISFSYERKGAELFSNIKFKVENNERVWVPGPSGYGRTTFVGNSGWLSGTKQRTDFAGWKAFAEERVLSGADDLAAFRKGL